MLQTLLGTGANPKLKEAEAELLSTSNDVKAAQTTSKSAHRELELAKRAVAQLTNTEAQTKQAIDDAKAQLNRLEQSQPANQTRLQQALEADQAADAALKKSPYSFFAITQSKEYQDAFAAKQKSRQELSAAELVNLQTNRDVQLVKADLELRQNDLEKTKAAQQVAKETENKAQEKWSASIVEIENVVNKETQAQKKLDDMKISIDDERINTQTSKEAIAEATARAQVAEKLYNTDNKEYDDAIDTLETANIAHDQAKKQVAETRLTKKSTEERLAQVSSQLKATRQELDMLELQLKDAKSVVVQLEERKKRPKATLAATQARDSLSTKKSQLTSQISELERQHTLVLGEYQRAIDAHLQAEQALIDSFATVNEATQTIQNIRRLYYASMTRSAVAAEAIEKILIDEKAELEALSKSRASKKELTRVEKLLTNATKRVGQYRPDYAPTRALYSEAIADQAKYTISVQEARKEHQENQQLYQALKDYRVANVKWFNLADMYWIKRKENADYVQLASEATRKLEAAQEQVDKIKDTGTQEEKEAAGIRLKQAQIEAELSIKSAKLANDQTSQFALKNADAANLVFMASDARDESEQADHVKTDEARKQELQKSEADIEAKKLKTQSESELSLLNQQLQTLKNEYEAEKARTKNELQEQKDKAEAQKIELENYSKTVARQEQERQERARQLIDDERKEEQAIQTELVAAKSTLKIAQEEATKIKQEIEAAAKAEEEAKAKRAIAKEAERLADEKENLLKQALRAERDATTAELADLKTKTQEAMAAVEQARRDAEAAKAQIPLVVAPVVTTTIEKSTDKLDQLLTSIVNKALSRAKRWSTLKQMYRQKIDHIERLKFAERQLFQDSQCTYFREYASKDDDWILPAHPQMRRAFHQRFVIPILMQSAVPRVTYLVGPPGIGKDETMRNAAQYINNEIRSFANTTVQRVVYAEADMSLSADVIDNIFQCSQDAAHLYADQHTLSLLYLRNYNNTVLPSTYQDVVVVLDSNDYNLKDALKMPWPSQNVRKHFVMRYFQKLVPGKQLQETHDGILYSWRVDGAESFHAMIDEFVAISGPSHKYDFVLQRVGQQDDMREARRGVYAHPMTFVDMTRFLDAAVAFHLERNRERGYIVVGGKQKTIDNKTCMKIDPKEPYGSIWTVKAPDPLGCICRDLQVLSQLSGWQESLQKKQANFSVVSQLKQSSFFVVDRVVKTRVERNQKFASFNRQSELDRLESEIKQIQTMMKQAVAYGFRNKLVSSLVIDTVLQPTQVTLTQKRIEEFSKTQCIVATQDEIDADIVPSTQDLRELKKQWSFPSSVADSEYELYLKKSS